MMMMHAYRCSGECSSKRKKEKVKSNALSSSPALNPFYQFSISMRLFQERKTQEERFEKKGIHDKMTFHHYRPSRCCPAQRPFDLPLASLRPMLPKQRHVQNSTLRIQMPASTVSWLAIPPSIIAGSAWGST